MLVIFKGKRNKYTAFLTVKNIKELQASLCQWLCHVRMSLSVIVTCVILSGMPRLPFFPENRLRGDFGPRHMWPEQGNRLRWVSRQNGTNITK